MQFGDAINNAFERTKYLLWERRSRTRWRNFALLSWLCGYSGGGGGGGGGDFSSLFKGTGDKRDTSMRLLLGCSLASALGAGASEFDEIKPYIGLILVLCLGIFALSMFVLYASNFARVILVENIVHDRDAIAEPWSRLSGMGWSVLWWGVGYFFVSAVILGLLVVAPGVGIAVMGEHDPGMYLLYLPFFLWLFAVLLPLGFIQGYFQEIVIPLMYRQKCSSTEAWAIFKPLFNAQKGKWIVYMLLHFFLVMAASIVASMIMLMVLLMVGLVLGLPTLAMFAVSSTAGIVTAVVTGTLFVIACFVFGCLLTMPVTVLGRSFSMYILQQVAPEYGFLPLGGRPLSVDPITGMVQGPEAGVGLNPAETQPMPTESSEWSDMPPHG